MSTQSHAQFGPTLFEWRDGFKIFIVDDNVSAADSLTKLLRKVGMDASCAYAARDALACNLSDYDVIFLDIGMPDMDGYELIHELRARGVLCPIVALTGYGLAEDKQKAHEAGFAAHLTKPIGLREIREVLSQVVLNHA